MPLFRKFRTDKPEYHALGYVAVAYAGVGTATLTFALAVDAGYSPSLGLLVALGIASVGGLIFAKYDIAIRDGVQ